MSHGEGWRTTLTRGIGAATALFATPACGQSDDRDLAIDALPRRGYETRDITLGGLTIQPRIEAQTAYNSNVFATPTDRRGAAVFNLRPAMTLRRKGTLDLAFDLHTDLIRYSGYARENVDTFGVRFDGSQLIASRQSVTLFAAFDRTYERRSDPEARTDPSRPPALIDLSQGELRYRFDGSRFGLLLSAGATRINYLAAADAVRDVDLYRITARASLNLTGQTAIYLQPYVNRRTFAVAAARGGFGDATTYGVLSGLSLAIGQRLNGNIGVGVFSAQPEDPGFRRFTGVALDGRLVWRPRTRTAVVLTGFRGDVATVRQGAASRVDLTFAAAVEQEVRHNLLLHAGLGYRNIRYRGGIDSNQTYKTGSVEVRYLFNRYLTASLGTDFQQRRANQLVERFDRAVTRLAIRFTY